MLRLEHAPKLARARTDMRVIARIITSALLLLESAIVIAAGGADGGTRSATRGTMLRAGAGCLRLRGGVDPELGDFAGDISYESGMPL